MLADMYVHIFWICLCLNWIKCIFVEEAAAVLYYYVRIRMFNKATKTNEIAMLFMKLNSFYIPCYALRQLRVKQAKRNWQCFVFCDTIDVFEKFSTIMISLSFSICNLDATRPCIFLSSNFHPSVYSREVNLRTPH